MTSDPERAEAERLAEAMDITVNITHKDGFIRGDAQKQLQVVLSLRDATIARLQQERANIAEACLMLQKGADKLIAERDAATHEAEALREEVGRLRSLAYAYLAAKPDLHDLKSAAAYLALLKALDDRTTAQPSADDIERARGDLEIAQAVVDDWRYHKGYTNWDLPYLKRAIAATLTAARAQGRAEMRQTILAFHEKRCLECCDLATAGPGRENGIAGAHYAAHEESIAAIRALSDAAPCGHVAYTESKQ